MAAVFMDVTKPASNRDYTVDFQSNKSQNLSISADDSPKVFPPNTQGALGVAVDVTENLRLYLAWEWPRLYRGCPTSQSTTTWATWTGR